MKKRKLLYKKYSQNEDIKHLNTEWKWWRELGISWAQEANCIIKKSNRPLQEKKWNSEQECWKAELNNIKYGEGKPGKVEWIIK